MSETANGRLRLTIVPVSLKQARAFVAMWHRSHAYTSAGHKFSLGVATDDRVLRGVAIVGRPVARHMQDGRTLEVNRTATDGTPNTNSALYGAAWRVAKGLGYTRLITYTQQGESGASLLGASFRVIAHRPPNNGWDRPSRRRGDHGVDHIPRTLWEIA